MFWNHYKKPRTSALEERQVLSRLASKFIAGDTKEAWTDSLVKEWMIQRLPKEACQYVRERTPETSMDTIKLIEKFFSAKEEPYTSHKGMILQFDPLKSTGNQESRYHPYRKDYGRDSWRQQSPSSEPTKKEVVDLTKESQEDKGKQRNPQEKKTSKPFECFNCGKVGHMARDCRSKRTPRVNQVQEVSVCQLCDGKGHTARDCPNRVNRVNLQTGHVVPTNIQKGKIQGTTRQNILLDSGAQVSVIAEEVLPKDYRRNGTVQIKTITSPITQHPATLVDIEIGEQKFTVRAAVLKKENITHDLIVGENIANMSIHELMNKTVDDTPKVETKASKKPEPAQVNQLQMVGAITRAQAEKMKKSEEEDSQATTESQADITSWDDVEALPVTDADEVVEEKQPMPSTPTSPADRRQMARAQKDDETLSELFQKTKQEDSSYLISKGLLMKKSTDSYGNNTQLLVVLQPLRKEVFEKSHSCKLAGHFGAKKTLKKIVGFFYWPNISKDVTEWCKTCEVCQKHNMGVTQRTPLRPLPTIQEPWTRVAIDIVDPLPRTKSGYKYILMGMDLRATQRQSHRNVWTPRWWRQHYLR